MLQPRPICNVNPAGRPDFDDATKKRLVSICKSVQVARKETPNDPMFASPEMVKFAAAGADCESIIAPAHNMMTAMKSIPAICDPDYAASLVGKPYVGPKAAITQSPKETYSEIVADRALGYDYNCASICSYWTIWSCTSTCGSAVASCFTGNFYGCATKILSCARTASKCCTCGCRAKLFYCNTCGY